MELLKKEPANGNVQKGYEALQKQFDFADKMQSLLKKQGYTTGTTDEIFKKLEAKGLSKESRQKIRDTIKAIEQDPLLEPTGILEDLESKTDKLSLFLVKISKEQLRKEQLPQKPASQGTLTNALRGRNMI
ncbi:MAG: hypothetical protein A2Y14_02590 [Verrucomicrobia bacterium GWF2_51_19]|nr:MAG: hypothetical protein A2Y14_02590 [Verrucomicrobia bacterium GWF2_51_19]HCJ11614.1 hypothetical protein [Opitutae bacterium]